MKKVMLLQVRTDDMRAHEAEAVRARLGDLSVDLIPFDAYLNRLTESDLEGLDGLILGGSGEFCVSERKIPEVIENVEWFLHAAHTRHVPTLAICFGHQILSEALGGRVEMDVARQELGTTRVSLTPSGETDPLLSYLKPSFMAQEGHKDHVTRLPDGAVWLAYTEQSTYQAYRLPEGPTYSVQFHPELMKSDVATRLDYYRAQYLEKHDGPTDGADPYQKVLDRTFETPEVCTLIARFIELYVLPETTTTLDAQKDHQLGGGSQVVQLASS